MTTALDNMVRYSDAVISGKIVACKKHRWACERFLRDLDKQGHWPWVFDSSKADVYLYNWIPLFKHSKGPMAGQQKIACDYEEFVYGNIYGWIHEDTGMRRFRRSYEQLARKNAKSQDKAIQSLFEISAFGEGMAEAYVAATKKEQTRHVWGEAAWLFKNSPLADKFTCKFDQELQQTVIRHKKSGSFFSRLSKDDKKSGDGTNPHFLVIDEYHLHETTEYYDLGTSGMKTRAQPLLSIITTAGFDLNNPCYRVEYDYVSKILDPNNPVENDRYFAIVCELETSDSDDYVDESGRQVPAGELIDDIKDRSVWVKANPIIGTTDVGIESIGIDVDEALDKPEKMRDVLTKTFNVWVNQRDAGYMNLAKWAACGASPERPFPDLRGVGGVAGVDLSATIDLTSVTFDFPIGDGEYAVMSHSFMPEDTIAARRNSDKVPYDLWVKQGWITATPGAQVDYAFVLEYIDRTIKENGYAVSEVAFDRALATWLEGQVVELGYTAIEIPQSYTGLSLATKDFRGKVVDGKVIHNNNPVLTWAMGNAIVRKGPSENIMLDKSAAKHRFDPVAALITAHSRAMLSVESSVYDKRGMLSLMDD